jgi:hypothetical protein
METYEPFYIASSGIPPFDERFLGYGFTRNSQVFFPFIEMKDVSIIIKSYIIT